MKHFSPAEKQEIEAAVKDAESLTSGEIVPVVVETSGHYSYVGHWLGLAGLALSTAILVFVPSFRASLWELSVLFVAQLLGWVLGWTLGHWPPVVRLLAGKRRMETEVHETALASFLHNGLHQTDGHTGILVFVSLLEHQVRIVADEGIHEEAGQAFWDAEASRIAAGIGAGRGPAVMAETIRSLGQKLAAHFPAKPGHQNQLPNGVRDR